VAIIHVLVAVLVGVGSIVTGKIKKQFEGLNENKNASSKSSATAEQLPHVHNVVVGDTVLFEPSGSLPDPTGFDPLGSSAAVWENGV
jgi:uncharacterized protein with ACT and thioredoxin-like domain